MAMSALNDAGGKSSLSKTAQTSSYAEPSNRMGAIVFFLLAKGYPVGPKRIRRLLRLMGRETLYRRKNLTKLGLRQFIKPYLLRGLTIDGPNQVWCTDITYIPMKKEFMYLTAPFDVYRAEGIQISMDGKGRATDNIWIERFWKSIKHDYVYLNPAEDGFELYQGIDEYMLYYNEKTHHTTRQSPNQRYQEPIKKAA
jgi:putative transposase